MKLKKLPLMGILLTSIVSMTSCNTTNSSSLPNSDSNVVDNDFIFNNDGVRRLNTEPEEEMVNLIIDTLISKGGSLITGGIQTYAKAVVLNLLKECGFDFRDATTKTLEKIQQQLTAIDEKVTALSKKTDQYHSQDILNKVLGFMVEAQNKYLSFAITGMGDLADTENDETLTEEEKEAARQVFFDNSVSKFIIDGSPLCSFVSSFCDAILTPNLSDPGKDIFYYYSQTIGYYDTWSTLRIKNVKNFMAYLDSAIVALVNLSKFQIYYMTKGKDSATIHSYEDIINKSIAKANLVNEKFKVMLDSLKEYEDKQAAGVNVYLSTGKEYSLRMATLTYSYDGDVDNDSRRALLLDNPTTRNTNRIYYYQPNQDIISSVVSDFKEYVGAYFAKTYTLQDYLTYAGFYAKDEELYAKAAGLYNGNFNVDSHGLYYDDHDYSISYYDNRCEYVRKTVYSVDSYHNPLGGIDHTTIKLYDNNYYLCFATPDGNKQKLDGKYSYTSNKEDLHTINKDQYYHFDSWEDIYKGDVNGWYLHDCW